MQDTHPKLSRERMFESGTIGITVALLGTVYLWSRGRGSLGSATTGNTLPHVNGKKIRIHLSVKIELARARFATLECPGFPGSARCSALGGDPCNATSSNTILFGCYASLKER
jgi:hypothetical protein